MAEKNAILRHVFYSAVRQAVNKTAAFLPRNWGPAILQLGSRYTAMEAPLHGNGGPVMMQRRLGCDGAIAPLTRTEGKVRRSVAQISTPVGFLLSKCAENSCSFSGAFVSKESWNLGTFLFIFMSVQWGYKNVLLFFHNPFEELLWLIFCVEKYLFHLSVFFE